MVGKEEGGLVNALKSTLLARVAEKALISWKYPGRTTPAGVLLNR
jgi:hypothetical protein